MNTDQKLQIAPKNGEFVIRYTDSEVFPHLLTREARSRGISPEQYIRRIVAEKLASVDLPAHAVPQPGISWRDYFSRNGVLREVAL